MSDEANQQQQQQPITNDDKLQQLRQRHAEVMNKLKILREKYVFVFVFVFVFLCFFFFKWNFVENK